MPTLLKAYLLKTENPFLMLKCYLEDIHKEDIQKVYIHETPPPEPMPSLRQDKAEEAKKIKEFEAKKKKLKEQGKEGSKEWDYLVARREKAAKHYESEKSSRAKTRASQRASQKEEEEVEEFHAELSEGVREKHGGSGKGYYEGTFSNPKYVERIIDGKPKYVKLKEGEKPKAGDIPARKIGGRSGLGTGSKLSPPPRGGTQPVYETKDTKPEPAKQKESVQTFIDAAAKDLKDNSIKTLYEEIVSADKKYNLNIFSPQLLQLTAEPYSITKPKVAGTPPKYADAEPKKYGRKHESLFRVKALLEKFAKELPDIKDQPIRNRIKTAIKNMQAKLVTILRTTKEGKSVKERAGDIPEDSKETVETLKATIGQSVLDRLAKEVKKYHAIVKNFDVGVVNTTTEGNEWVYNERLGKYIQKHFDIFVLDKLEDIRDGKPLLSVKETPEEVKVIRRDGKIIIENKDFKLEAGDIEIDPTVGIPSKDSKDVDFKAQREENAKRVEENEILEDANKILNWTKLLKQAGAERDYNATGKLLREPTKFETFKLFDLIKGLYAQETGSLPFDRERRKKLGRSAKTLQSRTPEYQKRLKARAKAAKEKAARKKVEAARAADARLREMFGEDEQPTERKKPTKKEGRKKIRAFQEEEE
tara:strand:+ start:5644 stop:7581 length:1938 start_codon:yes stop_codon:yes gene_type:complete